MPIAYCFRFCCHFYHFTFDINLLSINPLREVLKVTATKNKNKLEVLNPIRSLEPKHILFYYRADCLALERRHSGLRQVTKTDKMLIRK